jgi:hypothetical protein
MSEPRELPAPPAGEHIHMPAPSIIPLLNATGLAVAIVGITTSLFMVIAGGLLFLATTVRWIADTRREIESLPADSSGH